MSQRLKLFFYHLLFSLFLLSISLVLVFVYWYQYPFFIAEGVSRVYFILLGIDLIIGPVLTFFIYKKNIVKFYFDLCCILLIQLIFFTYGLYTIHQGRVAWLVFVVDDIELVSPIDLHGKTLPAQYKINILDSPLWVAAVYSNNPKLRQKQKEAEMFSGVNLAETPETYQLLENRYDDIRKKSKKLSELNFYNSRDMVNNVLKKFPNAKFWLPVKAYEVDMVALFDQQGKPLQVVNLRPWH